MGKYVITGSTGGLGFSTLQNLLKLGFNPQEIILSVYNIKGVDPQLASIVHDVRHGDYNRKETLEKAFRDAEVLFLVSSTTIINDKRTAEHQNAIEAAKTVDIKHIFYTSLAYGYTRETQVMAAHLDTEDSPKASNLTYTIIREGTYSESFPVYLGYLNGKNTTEIVIPADGGVSFASKEELGEGTAKILMCPNDYRNQTVFLTRSKAYTLTEAAAIVSKALDRDILLRVTTLQDYIDRNLKDHDETWVRFWATTYLAIERGELAHIDKTLEKLLGHPSKSLERTVEEKLANKDTELYDKYRKTSTSNKQ